MTTSFVFPESKEDFTAENGVTYTWDENRWRTKAYKLDESKLENYLPLTGGTITGDLNVSDLLSVKDGVVEYFKNRTGITQMPAKEIVNAGILSNLMLSPSDGYLKDYLPLTGGTINGLTTVTFTDAPAGNSYVFNVVGSRLPEGQSSAFRVTAEGSVKAGHEATSPFMATVNNDVVTKGYLDSVIGDSDPGDVDFEELDNRYLQLSGGVLTNSLCWNRGEKPNVQFCIEPNRGSPDTNIYALSDGQLRFRSTHTADINDRVGSHIVLDPNNGTPETKIYNVVYPTDGAMAANREYVDDRVASPARLQWMYNGTVDNSNDPGSGNMVYHPGGNDDIIGYLRLSFVTYEGMTNLGDGKFSDTLVRIDYGPVGCVWQWRFDIKKWKLMLQFRVGAWRWNFNNHFEFGITSQNGRTFEALPGGAPYFVTVGGFF